MWGDNDKQSYAINKVIASRKQIENYWSNGNSNLNIIHIDKEKNRERGRIQREKLEL